MDKEEALDVAIKKYKPLDIYSRDDLRVIFGYFIEGYTTEKENWISVKDKLPEIQQRVLVFRKLFNNKNDLQLIEWWEDDESTYTHWMPILKLPGEL